MPPPLVSSTALETLATETPPAEPSEPSEPRSTLGSAAGPRPSFLRRYWLKTLVSLALAVLIAWGLKRSGFDVRPPSGAAFSRVSWSLYGLHVVILVVLHLFRAMRLRHLLHPIAPDFPNRRVLAAQWISFTAILLLPLRTGEVVRPYLLRDGKRITMSAAVGTTGAERVVDGLVVTILLAVTLLFVPHLEPLPKTIGDAKIPVAAIPVLGFTMLGVFTILFAGMAFFYFQPAFSRRMVLATVGRVSPRIGDKLAGILAGIADGLHFLSGPRHAVPFMAETLVYWALNATMMWVLGLAVGLSMTFGHACAVMGVLAIGILAPAGPGLYGVFQAATWGGLAMYFAPALILGKDSPGGVYVFLLYGTQFVWNLVAAAFSAAIDPAMMRRATRSLTAPAT
ncbi:MAG: hypothetical protein NVSMB47_02980 [Polyangiales bacterium]